MNAKTTILASLVSLAQLPACDKPEGDEPSINELIESAKEAVEIDQHWEYLSSDECMNYFVVFVENSNPGKYEDPDAFYALVFDSETYEPVVVQYYGVIMRDPWSPEESVVWRLWGSSGVISCWD